LGQLAAAVASLAAQHQGKQAEGTRLRDTIVAQDQLVATLRERVDMRSTLLDKNAGSRAAVIDAQETLQKEGTTLAAQKGQIGEVAAALLQAQRDIDRTYSSFIADNADKLDDVDRRIDEDRQKLAKAKIKTAEMTLKSPIDGVVIGLTVTSVGQVVTTGQQILQVVPRDAALEIEAYLPNADVGFVKTDQAAVVKIESFPFTRYGTLVAHVTRVAEDAIPQAEAEQREGNPASVARDEMFGGGQRTQNLVYPVNLTLDRTTMDVDGRAIPLVPGMAVTVEIKTGTRRILEYLFSPVFQIATTAMKER
ncbi:HlyD family type I secretion periplasmic adaptor subunit, partial [Beijerinckia sp. L45]|uniref:HlyD family type I secretion periplasmic adaptor subunit n=1 Tax=Beijerinckia sp. L45 TaxID=1641855 RepID=UPI00131D1273